MKWQLVLPAIALATLVAVCAATAGMAIYISNEADGVHYCVNDRPLTQQQVTNVLGQLGGIDTNLAIFLLCNTNVSALQVAETLGQVQEAGFRNVILMVPTTRDGQPGVFQLTLDCRKYEFGESCGNGASWSSGFRTTYEKNHSWADCLLQKVSASTNCSQQSAAPLPSAPAGPSDGAR